MAVDFSTFDEQVDLNALQKEVQEADDSQFEDVPDGDYDVSFDKMEIKPTKKGDKLMFSVQCSILKVIRRVERFSSTVLFPATPHRSGLMAWQSNLFAHGLISLKQIQYRNLSTTVILRIVFLIFFRKYRVKLVQQLLIKLMISTQSQSTKHLICKNF